jgi:deoxyadenosine/deoxycytidine kinase
LRTDPGVCYERIKARNRPEEVTNIDVKYLEDLHNLHELWLLDEANSNKLYRPNVIVIDANQSMDDVCNRIYKEAHAVFIR